MSYASAREKYRSLVASLTALLFYTSTDILVWQRVFEANKMTEYANSYYLGWFVSLAGYATIGVLLLWGQWKDTLFFLTSLFIGAFSGLEDVLYYLLDGKPLPKALPWLLGNPMIHGVTQQGVVTSVLFWLAVLAILYVVLYVWLGDQEESFELLNPIAILSLRNSAWPNPDQRGFALALSYNTNGGKSLAARGNLTCNHKELRPAGRS